MARPSLAAPGRPRAARRTGLAGPGPAALAARWRPRGERVVAVGRDADVARPRRTRDARGRAARARSWCPASTTRTCTSSTAASACSRSTCATARDEADFARRLGAHARTLPAGHLDPERELGPRGLAVEPALPHARSRSTPSRRTIPSSCSGSTATWRWPTRWPCAWPASPARRPTPEGGTIVRDARGEPTGILKDNAMDLVHARDPRALARDEPARGRAARARRGGAPRRHHASRTTRRSTRCPPTRSCATRGELTARIYVWRAIEALTAADAGRGAHRAGRRLAPPGRAQDPLRRLDGRGHRRLLRALRRRAGEHAACCSTRTEELERPRSWRPTPPASSSPCTRSATAPTPWCSTPSRRRRAPTARATGASASSTRRSCARPTSRASARSGVDRLDPALALHRRHALGGDAHRRASACRDAYHFRSFLDAGVAGRVRHRLVRGAARPASRPLRRGDARASRGRPAGRLVAGGEDRARGRARPLHARLRLRGVRGGGARARSMPGTLADLVVFGGGPVRGPAARDPARRRWTSPSSAGASSSSERCRGRR